MAVSKYGSCVGCAACASICRHKAIKMARNDEGFLYPEVDNGVCTNCGLCEKVCPALLNVNSRKPLVVYGAQARDEDYRRDSASGGMFAIIAEAFIADGGIVYGAVWDSAGKKAKYVGADDVSQMQPMRGSKYVQAEIGDAFDQIRKKIKEGRKVLFCGTPCHVFGLNLLIGKNDLLFTLEIICMGVPSVGILSRISPELFSPDKGRTDVTFRDKKKHGWANSCMREIFITSDSGRQISDTSYYQLMSRHYIQRESCYNCPARGLRSGADLTIGDFWRVRNYFPEMDDDSGTSLVLVNTVRGRALWDGVQKEIKSVETDYSTAKNVNNQLEIQLSRPPLRTEVAQMLKADFSLEEILKRLPSPSQSPIRKTLSHLKRLAKQLMQV